MRTEVARITGVCALLAAAAFASVAGVARATTHSHVAGVITALGGGELTIAPPDGAPVTGKLDSGRTRVFVNGRAARPAQLQLSYGVRAELALDDVWLIVAASSH